MRQPPKESSQSLSYHIALGGIIAALCIACMFLTGVFPMFYLILPMLASAFIYIMTLETGGYWGFLTYLSVGLLSVFVTPNKDASLAFLFFFGYFPLLRNGMERFRWKFLGFLLRLAVFNAAVLTFFWVSVYVLGMKELLESLGDYGKYGGWILLDFSSVVIHVFMEESRKRYVFLLRFQYGKLSRIVSPIPETTNLSRCTSGVLKQR